MLNILGRRRTSPVNYLIAGLAKTGTTILFTTVRDSLPGRKECFFEPATEAEFARILARGRRVDTLTKALLTDVLAQDHIVQAFQRVMFIVRDPRDQLVSVMLYRFWDFKNRGDLAGYERAHELLRAKIDDPPNVSTLGLFDAISALARRASSAIDESPVAPASPRRSSRDAAHTMAVRGLAKRYRAVVEFIRRYRPHIVSYEDFVDGRVDSLSDYLGVPVSISRSVDRAYRRVERTRSSGEWRSWLTGEDLGVINEHLADSMEALGYPIVASADHRTPIPLATTLDYIRQFRP